MRNPDFAIQVIGDVTCDIAPVASVPSTIRPSTIADPVFGFDPQSGKEIEPYSSNGVDIMSIDNLPNELPRDASASFGKMFLTHILPDLLTNGPITNRGSITQNGELTTRFDYLSDYARH